ncbi:TPA: helix-turn-helix transcriptional regulator [Streptococcus suis]|nr:helix-turn-helix transcriptional regulator [Streptococcus suis]
MNRLKELRKEKKLTQQELADIAKVSKRTYIYWENSERQIKPDKAQALADHFGVSVGYLLGYETDTKTVSLVDGMFDFQLEIMKNIRKMEYGEVLILEQIARDLNREAILEQSRRYHVNAFFAKFPEMQNEI